MSREMFGVLVFGTGIILILLRISLWISHSH